MSVVVCLGNRNVRAPSLPIEPSELQIPGMGRLVCLYRIESSQIDLGRIFRVLVSYSKLHGFRIGVHNVNLPLFERVVVRNCKSLHFVSGIFGVCRRVSLFKLDGGRQVVTVRSLNKLDIHFVEFTLGKRHPFGVFIARLCISNVEEVFPLAPILVGDINWTLGH